MLHGPRALSGPRAAAARFRLPSLDTMLHGPRAASAVPSTCRRRSIPLAADAARCWSPAGRLFSQSLPYLSSCAVHLPDPATTRAFRGRKHYNSQNVLAVVDFDMRFTYVLAGWEGSTHDASILADSLSRPDGLQIPDGKFYLGDAGYACRPGIRPPFRKQGKAGPCLLHSSQVDLSIKRRRASHEERAVDMKTDVKMAVKLDMELDMKISHGRAREEREACARGEEEVQPPEPDIITWREYEALRNEMRREFRTKDDELKGTVDEIKQTLDATNVTVTGLSDQMTDIQRNIADMRLAIENLTVQQQQQEDDEDPELEDDAHNARGAPHGHRPRGWFHLAAMVVDKMKKMDWLKIEKLWSLHPHYSEDRKIKLASSEFDGYALRWWDSLVRNRDDDGAQPIRTWHAMKEVMTSRFVPTNYMRNIFDKLTLLRQGVKTVDEYYMEMEMLMQRGRVRESLEMTMQRFLNGLNWLKKQRLRDVLRELGVYTPRLYAPAPSTRSLTLLRLANRSPMYLMQRSPNLLQVRGSGVSTTRNRDMLFHTCGGKGHFKRDCPNRKVMFINEDNEYETGDDVDPNAPDNDDYDTDGEDAYPSDARTIVVSQRALNVLPSASTQRCNLFQTKALVGPDKACKVIIDGGSCRNLASKDYVPS
ncbi:hypothetical protein QYE76_013194 [Lolium multiflorum]|uniref:Uncharacterized protein n=1 Tax=Lolium multiflorum TaxID=4521 RepID=A0AAD8X703_LOLMU|nr:hypothetical protein QYE76_013194 [Lolium multiflorum]